MTHRRRLRFSAGVFGSVLLGLLAGGAAVASGSPVQVHVLVVKPTWGPQPYSDVQIDTAMQGAARFYATASFGKLAMTYTQTPWLDVMQGPLSCQDEVQQLPQLAASAGWDPSSYDRAVFLLPVSDNPSGCPAGTSFDDPPGAFLNGSFAVGTIIHELGHSFGMGHAGLLTCWYQQSARHCIGDPYGDTSDVMGAEGGSNILGFVGDFGALQKARAGWLTPHYITKSGVYKLAPLEVATALPQALVIRGTAYEYWIDERAPIANDAHLARLPAVTGFAVHRIDEDPLAPGADPLRPDYLVPNARSSSYYTPTGKTFTLPGVFTLTALSRTRGVVTIRFRSLTAPT